MASRKEGLEKLIGNPMKLSIGHQEPETWQSFKTFDWSDQKGILIKTVTHPASALKLLDELDDRSWKIHLSNGAKTLYLAADTFTDLEKIDSVLTEHSLPGLLIRGDAMIHPLLGKHVGLPFIERIQGALNPNCIFQSFSSKKTLPPNLYSS